jgi:hypothetical protein
MSIGWPDLASGTLLALLDNAGSGTQAPAFSNDPDTPNSTWSVTSVDPDGTPTDDDTGLVTLQLVGPGLYVGRPCSKIAI